MENILKDRIEFVYLFDVKDGNPNGDPDAGNLPRVDPESGHGLVTDVCLKRKVRNFVSIVKHDTPPFDIYVKEKAVLNNVHEKAYQALGVDLKEDKGKRKGGDRVDDARKWMCHNFYDVRTFGAVMSTGISCGQVRGPVQITFARSIDPIFSSEHSITRMAVTTVAEAEKQSGDNRTMGRKHTVPYGLYKTHGFISANFAQQTGFSEDDLKLFFDSLKCMFDHDRSAARGEMNARGLYAFRHEGAIGQAPAHKLLERITVQKIKPETIVRSFTDYQIEINEGDLPSGVKLERLI